LQEVYAIKLPDKQFIVVLMIVIEIVEKFLEGEGKVLEMAKSEEVM